MAHGINEGLVKSLLSGASFAPAEVDTLRLLSEITRDAGNVEFLKQRGCCHVLRLLINARVRDDIEAHSAKELQKDDSVIFLWKSIAHMSALRLPRRR